MPDLLEDQPGSGLVPEDADPDAQVRLVLAPRDQPDVDGVEVMTCLSMFKNQFLLKRDVE